MANFPSLRNDLKHSNSLYLRQHAPDPVAWQCWNEKSLKIARDHNKLLIISIGYASCHWCHVMAKEAFSDAQATAFMNEHFINIKVDREERPDLDQTYMLSLQVLSQQGGWPLNIVALPNGRPIWGCTYMPVKEWLGALRKIVRIQQEKPQSLIDYGTQIVAILKAYSLEKKERPTQVSIEEALNNLREKIDPVFGGFQGGPKFPMPCQLDLWGSIAQLTSKQVWREHWHKTLDQMGRGGIFDSLDGGFARYSVNETWNIPHFEKMAYDNGQLLNAYSRGYQHQKNPLYREIVEKTVRFIAHSWTTPTGGFYAALDADSEDQQSQKPQEGAYYTWTEAAIDTIEIKEKKAFLAYYGLSPENLWEGRYILHRPFTDKEFCATWNWSLQKLSDCRQSWESILLQKRNERKRPATDPLIITSWNAILNIGLLEAAQTFQLEQAASLAQKNMAFLWNELWRSKEGLYRNYGPDGVYTPAFLEDYAWMIAASIRAYAYDFEESYLLQAHTLLQKALALFWNSEHDLFEFSKTQEKEVFFEAFQTQDDVIPSPNAVMCENLQLLGYYFEEWTWLSTAEQMLERQSSQMLAYPRSHGYWLRLVLEKKHRKQIFVSGEHASTALQELRSSNPSPHLWGILHPNSQIPALKRKTQTDGLEIHICIHQKCLMPLFSVKEAQKVLEN